jgi:hypothetical protein
MRSIHWFPVFGSICGRGFPKMLKSIATKNNPKTTDFNELEKNEKTARLLTVAVFNDC